MIRALLRLLALTVFLLPVAAQAQDGKLDHRAVAARIVAEGNALMATYDPAKGGDTADGFSDLYFGVFEETGMETDIGAADPSASTSVGTLRIGLWAGRSMVWSPRSTASKAMRPSISISSASTRTLRTKGEVGLPISRIFILVKFWYLRGNGFARCRSLLAGLSVDTTDRPSWAARAPSRGRRSGAGS